MGTSSAPRLTLIHSAIRARVELDSPDTWSYTEGTRRGGIDIPVAAASYTRRGGRVNTRRDGYSF